MTENEAIKELKEAIECCTSGEDEHFKEALGMGILAIEEIQQYRAIGTIEEFKDLKEKSVAKKPIYSDFDDNGDDEIIPYKAICPTCGIEFEFGSWNEEENHHCSCGQRINWVEE